MLELVAILGIFTFVIGLVLTVISSYNIGKKTYDIKVQLEADVEKIIQDNVNNFLQNHGSHQCRHTWKIIKEVSLYSESTDKMPYGTRHTLQCEKCGELKYSTGASP